MNVKTTLVLVVLLAIVGAYVYFVAREATPTYEIEEAQRNSPQEQGEPLFAEALAAADVSRIAVARGEESAAFEKVDGVWHEVQPARFEGDAARLDALAQAATSLRWIDRVEVGKQGQPAKADLSLDPPRATVTLRVGEREHVVGVGRTSAGGRGYVSLDDKPHVYVVNDALQAQLFTPERLTAFRRKSLEVPAVTALEEVSVATREGGFTATKRDGRWYLGEGVGERASDEAIGRLARGVGSLTARAFVAGDRPLSTYGLEPPRLTVALRRPAAAEGQPPVVSTLRVGSAADLNEETVYATWTHAADEPSTVVFTVPKDGIDRLATQPDAVRDKRLTVVPTAADVTRVEMAQGERGTVQLQRDAGIWRFSAPGPDFPLDAAGARQYVETVVTAEAERFEPAPAGGEPVATLTLQVAGREQPEVVRFYPAEGDGHERRHWMAVREGERVGYIVDESEVGALFEPAPALREKLIFDFEPGEIRDIHIVHPGGLTYDFRTVDDRWTMTGADKFEVGFLSDLVEDLQSVHVESWVTDGRTPGDTPVVMTLRLREGTHEVRLDPKSRVATLDSLDTPFVLPPRTATRIAQEYRERSLLQWDYTDIAEVTLSLGNRKLTIRDSEDGNYVFEGGPSATQAQAAGTFDAVNGLNVLRWLDTPPVITEPPVDLLTVEVTTAKGEKKAFAVSLGSDTGSIETGDGVRWFTLHDRDLALIAAPIAPSEADRVKAYDDGVLR